MFHVRASASIEVFVSVYFYFLLFFLSTFYMVNRIISLCSWNIFRIQFRICIASTVSVILVMLLFGAFFMNFRYFCYVWLLYAQEKQKNSITIFVRRFDTQRHWARRETTSEIQILCVTLPRMLCCSNQILNKIKLQQQRRDDYKQRKNFHI